MFASCSWTSVPNRRCHNPASFTPGDKLVRPAFRRPGFIEPGGLERLYCRLGMGWRVVYSNQSLVSHLLLPKVRLFAFLGRRAVDLLSRTLNTCNDCFLIPKRDTIVKLFCGLSPSYSNLFFQNQATFS